MHHYAFNCAATLLNGASSKYCNSLASSVAHLGLKVTLVNSTFIPKHGLLEYTERHSILSGLRNCGLR